jgi:hypothetical protein
MSTATQPTIQAVVDNLAKEIKQGLSRPIYFEVSREPGSELMVRQVEFITPERFAQIAHVETRTVYS